MRKGKASYSIVELTVVISVITVLVSLTVPGIMAVMNRVHRAQAAHHLRTIAMAHAQFISDFDRAITFSDVRSISNASGINAINVNFFAAFLSKYNYIDDISVWAWDFDPLVKKYKANNSAWPQKIYNKSDNKIESNFENLPISVTCGVVECPNFDYKSLLKGKYPAAFSRGLKSDGYWDGTNGNNCGVFGDKGGLIAYYDGTVEWCTNTVGKFTKYLSNETTSQICATIPNNHLSIQSVNYADSNFLNWESYDACNK